MKVLLVADDRNLGACLRRRLEGDRHILDWTAEGHRALECASSSQYAAVVVDLGSAEICGIRLCAQLRNLSQDLPIMVLSAQDRTADLLESFSAGADDVLAKPFDLDELMARLAAIQRRKPRPGDATARPTRMIVLDRKTARRTRRVVGLTDRELQLFDLLFRHAADRMSAATARQAGGDPGFDRLDPPTALSRRWAFAREFGRKLFRSGAPRWR